jgi:hypothetical protein
MPTSVRFISILWIVCGLVFFVFRVRTIQTNESIVFYVVIASLFFCAAILLLLAIGTKIQLPVSFWNMSAQPDTSHMVFSLTVKQRRFVVGLSIVLILSVAALLMGIFGITAKLKECFPYYIIGILATLFFSLLMLHNYTLKIRINSEMLFVTSVLGWADISWNDVGKLELLTTTNRPKKTFSDRYATNSDLYASYKTLIILDKNGSERIHLSPENISADDMKEILDTCEKITGLTPSSKREEKNLNFF